RGRRLRHDHRELGSLFKAFEDEVRAVAVPAFRAPTVRAHVVFPRQSLGLERFVIGPLDWNPVVARKRLDPLLIFGRPFAQGLFCDGSEAVHVPQEVDDLLLARQEGQIAEDDDVIETVVYQGEQAAKQRAEGVHRSPPVLDLASATRSWTTRSWTLGGRWPLKDRP